ncbi:MAG: hypothetical protein JXA67_01195 [Micromonosporaceae bacterium]|nr:hypothetical protein [Micromonosporaceae bacterium]
MSGERMATLRRWWVVNLPVLAMLLLALGPAACPSRADGATSGDAQSTSAVIDLSASGRPMALGGSPATPRVLAQRGVRWACDPIPAVGATACRLAAPAGHWATTPARSDPGAGDHGNANQGRGPPGRV